MEIILRFIDVCFLDISDLNLNRESLCFIPMCESETKRTPINSSGRFEG